MTTRRVPRRGSTRRRSVAKRAVRWITSTLNAQLDAAGTLTSFDALGSLLISEKNEIRKVVTVHGRFNYSSDVGGQHVFGRFGLIVVTDDAMATGGGALPDPDIDTASPWYWNDAYATETDNLATERELRFALRTQRLIPAEYTLAFSMKVNPGVTATVHWNVGLRILLEHK